MTIEEIKDWFFSAECAPEHRKPYAELRIKKSAAQKLLLNNESMIIGGCVRYFGFRNIGLGCVSVELLPTIEKKTRIIE